jgi:hypothetical protein
MCRQTANAYQEASGRLISEPDIAHFFEEQAENRDLAAEALEKILDQDGMRPKPEELISPPTEGWTYPTDSDSTPEAIIESCHRGEERALAEYQRALGTLPEEWHFELEHLYQNTRSAVAKLHTWLDRKEAGSELG